MLNNNRKKMYVMHHMGRLTRLRYWTTMTVLCSFIFTSSCSYFNPGSSAHERAERLIDHLKGIVDPNVREMSTAFALSSLCSLSRLVSGQADGEIETAMSTFFMSRPSQVKARIKQLGSVLEAIPTATRMQLLGGLNMYDPGPCANAPDWAGLKNEVRFNHLPNPRLRTNYCAGNFIYANGTAATRAITVGSKVIRVDIDSGDVGEVAPAGSPVIIGVEGEFVSARHPDLELSEPTEGISPYGAKTNIPCSSSNNSACDANLGLICGLEFNGPARCIAYPVVQKEKIMVVRGYNFWDTLNAKLVLTPLVSGQGNQTILPIDGVDSNEPLDDALACAVPSPVNASHNRAFFNVGANAGAFYTLRMYNENGNFYTQSDVSDHLESRVIHVCYPLSLGDAGLPPDTVRECTAPQASCVADGATCVETWNTPPRELEDCSHNLGDPASCLETPRWFASERLTSRSDGINASDAAIVYVTDEQQEPEYTVTATLQAVDCLEETGWDWTGSDEPMVMLAGIVNDRLPENVDTQFLEDIDNSVQVWSGSDFDSNDRKEVGQVINTLDGLAFNDEVSYFLIVAEDDSFWPGFIGGGAVIAGLSGFLAYLATTTALTAGAAVGGGVLAVALGFYMTEHAKSDLLGSSGISATSLNFDERIGSNHAADFLTVVPQRFGGLPNLTNAPIEGEVSTRLVHPFVDDRQAYHGEPLEVQCNPGVCPNTQQCLVNRCVAPGFVDPSVGVGFVEQRQYSLNGGEYTLDILWEKKKIN